MHLRYQYWSCWICVLLYSGSIMKNISSFNLYLLYFKCRKLKKCSEFNLILLYIFLSKRKTLYKQNFLEHFSNKDLRTLHWQLIINWDNWNTFIIRFEQLRESLLKTINTSESFKCLWIYYIISWLYYYEPGNYMFKGNNRNTRKRCEICLKLTIKIPERIFIEHISHFFSSVSIVNFEQVNAGWEWSTER